MDLEPPLDLWQPNSIPVMRPPRSAGSWWRKTNWMTGKSKSDRTAFRENLQWLVERFAGGNISAFAHALSMNFFVLNKWLKGECLPCLDGLLQLSEKMNTKKLINLVLPGGLIRSVDADRIERIERMMREGPGNHKHFPNAAEIRGELQAATKQVPPPPLTGVAHRLGFKDRGSLYRVDANLCKRISKNYRKSADSYWWRQQGAKPICSSKELSR
jgi:hypothetical protein